MFVCTGSKETQRSLQHNVASTRSVLASGRRGSQSHVAPLTQVIRRTGLIGITLCYALTRRSFDPVMAMVSDFYSSLPEQGSIFYASTEGEIIMLSHLVSGD